MAVHYITWSPDDAETKPRFRARYEQSLERVVEQAEHDRDVNGRVGVRVEDAKGTVVWPKGGT